MSTAINTANPKISLIKEGDIVLFYVGRKGGLIGRDSFGKVILPHRESIANLKAGYAMIDKVTDDKENFYVVECHNVIHDYYEGISLAELKKVFGLHGFKLGFEHKFEHKWEKSYNNEYDEMTLIEKEVFMYNLDTKSHVHIETFSYPENCGYAKEKAKGQAHSDEDYTTFNSINLTIPASCMPYYGRGQYGFSLGSGNSSTFNLVFCRRHEKSPISVLAGAASNADKSVPAELSLLHNYTEDYVLYGDRGYDKLKACDPEIMKMFEGSGNKDLDGKFKSFGWKS